MTFFPYELKLRHVFTVATYSRTTTPDVQVEIEYEGVTGYGEASMPPYLLSLIHISEPTRLGMISYAVFCLKKKKNINKH